MPNNANNAIIYQVRNTRQQIKQLFILKDNARQRGQRNHQLGNTLLNYFAPQPFTGQCPNNASNTIVYQVINAKQ